MKVLVVGSGGREHALAWKARQSAAVTEVLCAPGNAGTASEPGIRNVDIASDDVEALLNLARKEGIELTIVGPEAPLVAGIVDCFIAAGVPCFGPIAAAAQLEGSKAFMKDFLQRNSIPTARYAVFADLDAALSYLDNHPLPVVIKADGLAAGKGVIVANDHATAVAAVRGMMSEQRFGAAGKRVVIEEFLSGEEASFIAMVDGRNILPLASSQDHKARDNGDSGPNTGGMGAYSPAPVVTPELHERIMTEVMQPTVDALAAAGTPYTGFLYAGIMVGDDGAPRVLEFNCRFGDPETQPIMMRLQSDLVELCVAALEGRLEQHNAEWDSRAALGVVMAAGGYPESYAKGAVISGLDYDIDDTKVFHAGTAEDERGNIVTAGGRVLCVVALGTTVAAAQARAYQRCSRIHWDNAYYRTDIGHRAA
ncbi:MAG: phosphoribosylamine--glycine ligase [Gammaproteobacteria bacterium]|nr:phosphoribosylamine--glycine ligase [Gammaproteobacteria bacterium]